MVFDYANLINLLKLNPLKKKGKNTEFGKLNLIWGKN